MPRGRPKGSGMAVDKPRGRLSAYAFFVQTCRTEHKKLHPDENVQLAEFSRQCSERWKTMSEAEKKKFHDLADQDKIRYNAQMRDFVPPGGLVGRRGRRSRGNKPPKDPNKPKRALSAFFYYANDERAKVRAANPDFSVGEVAKELGRQWNELTENDKLKYEKLAEEDRARYDREMTAYRAGEAPPKKLKATNGHPAVAAVTQDDDDNENGLAPDDDDDDDEEEDED
ncbi:high mobility group protein DSP1-like [Portunus trituberculatus]|uniref:HMGBa n=1 Tax=Portunus trituberculatus TaxID=210409 RepID=A0A2C9PG49_PORTR|nr:high mobility group protein DSP1-like [Portunus trituberculatus]ATL75652.1 HMGBa [Portunus trituberculatus]